MHRFCLVCVIASMLSPIVKGNFYILTFLNWELDILYIGLLCVNLSDMRLVGESTGETKEREWDEGGLG